MLAVQETKVQGEEETESMVRRFTSRYYACVSHAVGTSAGCVLFVRKLPGLAVQAVTSCLSGRLVVCDYSFRSVQCEYCVFMPPILGMNVPTFLLVSGSTLPLIGKYYY